MKEYLGFSDFYEQFFYSSGIPARYMSTIAPMVSVEPKQPTFKKPISFNAWKRKPIKIEKNALCGKFEPSGDFIVVNQIMGNFLNELLASRHH